MTQPTAETTAPRGLFAGLGRFCVRRRIFLLVAYALLVPVAAWFGGPVLHMLRSGGFEDPAAESWRVRDQLIRDLHVGVADIIALYTNKTGNVDDIEMLTGVLGVLETIEKDKDVVQVISYYTNGAPTLVSKDRTRTFVIVNLSGDEQHKAEVFERLKGSFQVQGADNIELDFAGFVPVNQSLYSTIESDLRRAELLAFPVTAVLLLLIFGSGVSASMPLVLGGLAVALAFLAMRILIAFTDLSIFAANVVTVLGLGLAIDYSLFIVSRYREELPALGVAGAIEKTVATTGRAVAFSGVTVAASLLGLFVFPQMYLHSIALGGVAVTLGAVALALTLLPAMLAVVGTRIDALKLPFSLTGAPVDEEKSRWHAVAYAVMKRPVLVVIGVTVPLLIFAVPFLRIDPSVPDHKILPADAGPRRTTELLDTEFLPHQATPHDVLVRVPGSALAPANLEKLWELDRAIRKIDGVAAVQSVFSAADIVGRDKALELLAKPRAEQDPNVLAALDLLTRGDVMRFAVVSQDDFNSSRSLEQVQALRALSVPAGYTIQVGGLGAILWDLKACIRDNTPWMVGIVVVVMFIVLFLVFGSITLPLKAMVMNSLSLTASFGALVWVFQDGRFAELLDYTPLGISDATQPIMMFAVVFGLSMDYEVLLLTRVREEYVRTGDNTLSVARGLSRTGRLITSAAALLVVVIGAFATSKILFIKALGVGMALAIALDATVIRALLVPAAMRLMGKWNWWAPRPLVRLWEKAGLSDLEGHSDEVTGTARK